MQMIYNSMLVVFTTIWLFVIVASCTNSPNSSLDIFPHYQFACDPLADTDIYETEFSFLQGSAHGFVHVEPKRVYFEYYFPTDHWVAFATADQSIQDQQYHCSMCYFEKYYPLSANTNHSNLYPSCIAECLENAIFVGNVNSDPENINNWNTIEFKINSQISKKLQKKMYRIPKVDEILSIWGSTYYPDRQYAHFETEIVEINVDNELKQFVHAKFWRNYYLSQGDEWKPFVNVHNHVHSTNTNHTDSFCFISVASFFGGQYPYDDAALNGMLRVPGFYIDSEHFANIHCYKTNDIKVNCGGDIWKNDDDDDDGTDYDVVMNENETNLKDKKKSDDLIHIDTDHEERVYDETTPTVINNDNTMTQFNSAKYWTQKTIQKKDFDVMVDSYDFTVINFGVEWSIHDRIFAPTWSEAEDKSNGMIFSDKNGQQAVVKFLHINCVTSQDLCAGIGKKKSIGIPAYPAVRLYRRSGIFVYYDGERKVDSILDFVTHLVETETVPIKSEIDNRYHGNNDNTQNKLDIKDVDFEQYLVDDSDTDTDTDLYFDNTYSTIRPTVKATVTNNDNTIKRKIFDMVIDSVDFALVNFDTEWCIYCRPPWSKVEDKLNGMIFSDKNEKQPVVKVFHIGCVQSKTLCSDIGIRAYPTVRLYKTHGRFVYYKGAHKADSILNFVKSFIDKNSTKTFYRSSETIQKRDFDAIIDSHDFSVIDFGVEWSIDDTRFASTWSEVNNKSNSMIFSDKNGKQISVKLLHINCVSFNDLCSSFGIGEYPTVRIYKRHGRFTYYKGERNADSILDFVKSFFESGTVAIKSEIKSDNNLDEYPEVVDFDTDYDSIYEQYLDGNGDESVNYYYGGILIICIGIIGIIILYCICFNKKQTDKKAKEQILLYDCTTIQTNLGEQEGI